MSYYGPASQRPPTPERNFGNDCTELDRGEHFHRRHKRLRKTARIVPWRDEWEFQEVGRGILSVIDDPASTKEVLSPEEAFGMISVWKSRLSTTDGLPHAIESSASLAQVYWRDLQQRNEYTPGFRISTTELRLSYSAAIVRCINGFADSMQQQRAMAASVSSLCERLGIPSWLVDVRHEAAHNALPSLEVLRLSASTLLEFVKTEYWVPKWNGWNHTVLGMPQSGNGTEVEDNNGKPVDSKQDAESRRKMNTLTPIECLTQYKTCALAWDASTVANDNAEHGDRTKRNDNGTTGQSSSNKRKKKTTPPMTTILPYDPLFGEVATLSSSDEDSDEDDEEERTNNVVTKAQKKGTPNLNKPAVNTSAWGSSIGTNTNRYFLLDLSTSKKKKKKKTPKPIHNKAKKKKGEKSPTDWAKLFVQSTPSLQAGYSIAVQYLVWGGIGEAPEGQGVLIPRSDSAFPATTQGISRCWQRYSPLVHVVCRTWLGFSSCLIINLVDFVLKIEDAAVKEDQVEEKSHDQNDELDAESTRKLYFLYAWIRLLLSQRFVAALDRSFAVETSTTKNTNPLELPLAKLEYLEILGYPLNSLLDRCRLDPNDSTPQNTTARTRQKIGECLEAILGENAIPNFGYPGPNMDEPESHTGNTGESSTTDVPYGPELNDAESVESKISNPNGEMSLEEMEAMLMGTETGERDKCSHLETETGLSASELSESRPVGPQNCASGNGSADKDDLPVDFDGQLPRQRRPVWVRCTRWDPCSIGTLPGYPS